MQWTPIYWGDYLRDTAHLDLTEHGAYIKMLAHYYSTGKPLPENPDKLNRICGAFSEAEREAVAKIVGEFFTLGADGYRNRRADAEIAKQTKVSEARRKAAEARHGAGDANAMQKQSKSNANAQQMQSKSTTRADANDLHSRHDPTENGEAPPQDASNSTPKAQTNTGKPEAPTTAPKPPTNQEASGETGGSSSGGGGDTGCKSNANAQQMQSKCNANGVAKGLHPEPQPQPQSKPLFPPISPPAEGKETGNEYPQEFERIWQARPRRAGNDPKPKAHEAWATRIREGKITTEEAEKAVSRYAKFCEATGKIGTETVMQMATFFGPKNEAYAQDWQLPKTKPATAERYTGLNNRYYGETRAGVLEGALDDD